MPEQTATADWTCSRCHMTVSWMPEVERPELPATWIEKRGELYCLGCRREMAGEEGLLRAPTDANSAERLKLKSQARIEFEIKRRPERPDNRIAHACKTSVVAVRRARVRLGMRSQGPS